MAVSQQNVIAWSHVSEQGKTTGLTGLIAEGVSQPYAVDVRNNGDWRLWHYEAGDKVEVVARGRARNITLAKQHALRAAVKHIPELRVDAEGDEGKLAKRGSSKAVSALRVWLLTALTIASCLWLVILMALHRPLHLLRFVFWFGVVAALTHLLLKWLDSEVKRVERLSQRALASRVNREGKK